MFENSKKTKLILLLALVPAVLCQQAARYGGGAGVPILAYNSVSNLDGSYRYNYETGNGIQAQEEGFLQNRGSALEAQVIQGSYSYTGPDGVRYSVVYVADERGFRARGAHLADPHRRTADAVNTY